MALSIHYPKKAQQLRILIWVAAVLLGLGLIFPIITLEKFVIVENTFSILSGTIELLKEGHWFLFLIIGGFSIVIPVLKLNILFKLVAKKPSTNEQLHKYLDLMHNYGKWAMLDVFVVAVMVVAVKLGAVADVQMRPGLYAFATSVVLTMFVTAKVSGLVESLRH